MLYTSLAIGFDFIGIHDDFYFVLHVDTPFFLMFWFYYITIAEYISTAYGQLYLYISSSRPKFAFECEFPLKQNITILCYYNIVIVL